MNSSLTMTSPEVVTPVDHTEQLRILASLLLGTCFGVILYGISVHQTYIFVSLQQTQQAARVPKPLVKIILLLETIHSGLCIHAAYDLLVTDRALGVIPDKPRWSMDILNVFAAVIFCFTQSLFGRQVYLIWPTYGLVIVSAAGLLTAGQLGAATAATVLLYMPQTVALTRKIRLLGVARSAAVMIASALLAGALIHRLRSLRSFTDFRKTDHRIKALITYTSNTGLLIGISSLLSLILALAWPQGQLCIAIDIVATQLYAVSLLTELNCSREYVYSDGSSIITETVRSPSVLAQPSSQWVNVYTSRRASRGHHMSAQSSSVSSAGINIKVTKTTEIVRDDGTAEIHLKGVL